MTLGHLHVNQHKNIIDSFRQKSNSAKMHHHSIKYLLLIFSFFNLFSGLPLGRQVQT